MNESISKRGNSIKEDWSQRIILYVNTFLSSPENRLWREKDEPAWGEPLVGFARGDDQIFEEFKEYVGPFHWTPLEIFNLSFPRQDVQADELTVISWILPQTEKTKLDNRKEDLFPAERWIRSRIAGEQLNEKLRDYLVSQLRDSAIEAVAPMRSPLWSRKESQRFGLASTWSERHAAYAAGLGTFGLSDGLITASGKAHRAGSVVARINVAPTPRPYNDHHAYCLFFNEGNCGACISRCPAGAISEQGHDKEICSNYVHVRCAEYASATFGMKGYGCGLCQTDVPCESRIPPKK